MRNSHKKMLNHEDTCLSLLKQLTGPHMVLSQDTPARKRLRTKGPDVKQEEREVKDEINSCRIRSQIRHHAMFI